MNSVSINSSQYVTIVVVVLASLAFLGAAAVGTATAQNNPSVIIVHNETTTGDDTTTADVVLTNAPDGLSGYYFDVIVEDPSVAQIKSASYPDRFGLTSEPEIGADGASITLEAADSGRSIEPGSTNVTLASVNLSLNESSRAELSIRPQQFDSDSGNNFTPSTRSSMIAGGATEITGTANDQGSSDESLVTISNVNSGEQSSDSGSLPVDPLLLAIIILSTLVVGLAVLVVRQG